MSVAHVCTVDPSMLATAITLLERGWAMIPSRGSEKMPCIPWRKYQTNLPSAEDLREWDRKFHPERWGPITGALSGIVVIDFDGERGRELMAGWKIEPHVRTGSGGAHLYVKHPGWRVPTLNAKSSKVVWPWPGLDIRGDGGFAVLLGRNVNGPYSLLRELDPDPWEVVPVEVREYLYCHTHRTKSAGASPSVLAAGSRVDAELMIRKALERAAADGRNNSGMWLACQLRDNGYGQAEAEAAMRNYRSRVSATNAKGERQAYTEAEMLATVREAYSRPARGPWEGRPAAPPRPKVSAPHAERANAVKPNLLVGFDPEDVGNAQRLLALYGDCLKYNHAFQKWLVWDQRRWRVDENEYARALAQKMMLDFAMQAVKAGNEMLTKFAASCRKSARITNAMREAQPHMTISSAELDSHPDLLNFENGTVDLRTGEIREHRREDFITKLVHYDYRPDAPYPTFYAFLRRITANHPGLISYLQKAFGYSLTGRTIEKAVFLLHGAGDNGKSTLLSTFLNLLEEYSVLLQIDSLMVRQESNNTQADLADLRGARFVMTSETEEGQRLAEGKLKRITQGMGRIKAVRKYENPIEFDESHKLWIDANHLPIVRGTDNAIWNRLHAVPFDVTIPKAEQDQDLPRKLAAEGEGILAWAVLGAVRWYREGLGKPPEVEQVAVDWRAESDHIGRFIDTSCVRGGSFQVRARKLYSAYKNWAQEGGERIHSETAFGNRMKELRLDKEHTERGTVYVGVGLKTDGPDGS